MYAAAVTENVNPKKVIFSGLLRGLEEFDRVAGRVIEQDLGTAWPGHDFVAKVQARVSQSLHLGVEVVHLDMNPVPAAGDWFTTSGHNSAARTGLGEFAIGVCWSIHSTT
jgi:hypothetical protein